MPRMQNPKPARKVMAGAFAGALATLAVWVANSFLLSDPVPAEVSVALTTALTFAVSYFVPPSAQDQVVVNATPSSGLVS